jgi:hypothetical protein
VSRGRGGGLGRLLIRGMWGSKLMLLPRFFIPLFLRFHPRAERLTLELGVHRLLRDMVLIRGILLGLGGCC